jgi:hypothetical protein
MGYSLVCGPHLQSMRFPWASKISLKLLGLPKLPRPCDAVLAQGFSINSTKTIKACKLQCDEKIFRITVYTVSRAILDNFRWNLFLFDLYTGHKLYQNNLNIFTCQLEYALNKSKIFSWFWTNFGQYFFNSTYTRVYTVFQEVFLLRVGKGVTR